MPHAPAEGLALLMRLRRESPCVPSRCSWRCAACSCPRHQGAFHTPL